MKISAPESALLSTLGKYGLEIISKENKIVRLRMGYTIEIERESLFKLLQGDQVIAPFADVEELCRFIQMDIQLNEEG